MNDDSKYQTIYTGDDAHHLWKAAQRMREAGLAYLAEQGIPEPGLTNTYWNSAIMVMSFLLSSMPAQHDEELMNEITQTIRSNMKMLRNR